MSTGTARKPDARVATLHPTGKAGVRIDRWKYESMRDALLAVIPREPEGVPFGRLARLVRPHLDGARWKGSSVSWYVVTVKLDLEARRRIERVPGPGPQHVRRRGR